MHLLGDITEPADRVRGHHLCEEPPDGSPCCGGADDALGETENEVGEGVVGFAEWGGGFEDGD